MTGNIFNRREVSRERVMGLTLVDVFMQFVFMLLGLLLFIYVDDFSPEKWDQFARSGVSIYGANFSETWHRSPVQYAILKEENESLRKEINGLKNGNGSIKKKDTGDAPGREGCLEPKTQRVISAKFTYTKNGIQFDGLTDQYILYISDKHPEMKKIINELNSKKGKVFAIGEFEKTFSIMGEASCQHFFDRDENVWERDSGSFKYYRSMKAAISRINR